jgi:hypothetical protein
LQVSVIGLRFVVHTSSPLWIRFAWGALLLASTAFTVYQVQDRVSYFFSWPTNVGIRVERVNSMRFPTVTICNENRLQKSVADKHGLWVVHFLTKYTFIHGTFCEVIIVNLTNAIYVSSFKDIQHESLAKTYCKVDPMMQLLL